MTTQVFISEITQATTSFSYVAKGSLYPETYVCVFRGEKLPLKNDYTSIRLRAISQANP